MPSAVVTVLALGLALLVAAPRTLAAPAPRCPGTPNQCSLHGTCAINRLGEYVCNCQWGYHGHDCAKKMCPHGFDPTSSLTEAKRLRLIVQPSGALMAPASTVLQGTILLSFHAHTVELELPLHQITDDACATIFRRFQNLGDVSCVRTQFLAPATATYEITLHSFPVYPIMNNLYQHNGNPLSTDFWCDAAGAQFRTVEGKALGPGPHVPTLQCSFESITDRNVREYAPCSNHGLCNDRTGACTCEAGYYGDNCGNNKDEEDILVAPSTGPFFKGNALRVSAQREKSPEFNLIKADVAGATVFSLSGEGHAVFHQGSVAVNEGDLVVQSGQIRVQNGGGIALESADVRLQNGHVVIQAAADAQPAQSQQQQDQPLLQLTRLGGTPGSGGAGDYLRITAANAPLFRVSSVGTVVVHDGGIEVLSGGLRVQRGGIHVLTDGVRVMNGGIAIQEDDLEVELGAIRVLNGTIDVSSPSSVASPVLRVARQASKEKDADSASAPVLQLESASTSGGDGEMLIVARGGDGATVFDVAADGLTRVHAGGLKVAAGGLEVFSGGQQIHSGGLTVDSGGITVLSGGLTTHDGFAIADGGLSVQNSQLNDPILTLASSQAHYAGNMLELVVNQSTSDPPHRLIDAVVAPSTPEDDDFKESIFSVDSTGTLRTRGDIITAGNGSIVSSGPLISYGQVVFSYAQLIAGETIEIPPAHSYFRIMADGETAANRVVLGSAKAYAGQILVIQNDDDDELVGDVSIKPSSAAIFVFDGRVWRALTAASFDTSVIQGVQSFEAANDLNVGDVKLTAKHLQAAGQPAGHVALYGKGGELAHDDHLSYNTATATLQVEKLTAKMVKGHIDMTESELRGVEIVGGHISNVNMTEIEMVEVTGELIVESQAYFGAGITVDGQVMGSGAYIDASDARFKKDIAQIDGEEALAILEGLNGVKYKYRREEFPERRFVERQELGFIAQDVERVLPEAVTEDREGFKFVAYSRIVPVLAEALKAEQRRTRQLEAEIAELKREFSAIKEFMRTARAARANDAQQGEQVMDTTE